MASEKNGKGKTPPEGESGFFGSLLRPLKRHRVTLTKARKPLAPMRKGKASKKVKRAKKEKSKAVAKKKPIGLLSHRERQVNELKTLARIGRQDPERLAAIITRMLLDEEEGRERERLKYERMIWRKAEQHGQPPPEEEGKQKKDDDKGPVE